MQLRNAITRINGLGYMVDHLDLQSGLARRCLLETNFMTNLVQIQRNLDEIEQMHITVSNTESESIIEKVVIKLAQVRDIQGTIKRLENSIVLDDIELFELKYFCLLGEEIRELLLSASIYNLKIPELGLAVKILDPDNQKIPHFYIYDSYSEELAKMRLLLKEEKRAFNAIREGDIERIKAAEDSINKLYEKSIELEDEVRAKITSELLQYKEQINYALNRIASLDILIAKSLQIKKMELTKPIISSLKLSYTALFNPYIKASLEEEGKEYQPVDVEISDFPCLITGANMTGKTVLLKTVILSQYLFQFGFFVPATHANMTIVKEIFTCIDDGQNELKGLSSFAAEIININEITKSVLSGNKILVIIDELARTTNPYEGRAIVNGMLDFLAENKIQSLITTHYNGITAPCKKLRVKGFIETNISIITKDNINDFIDYSLVEDENEELPMKALRVAEILGMDEKLLNKMYSYIE